MKKSGITNPIESPIGQFGLSTGTLSLFIAFHLFAIICWALPTEAAPIEWLRHLVRPYMLGVGLDQSWDMFSPNPRDANTSLKAVIITQNRHLKTYSFPSIVEPGIRERFLKDRMRAFQELIAAPKNTPLLPEVALHIAGYFNDPADRPDKVIIVEFRSDIRPQDGDAPPAATPRVLYDDHLETVHVR
jgi:hypothetical protein